MLLNEICRLVTWFAHSHAKTAISEQSISEITSAFEFDPMWHGDHWQNLLSSPMDARRYVMEDWSVPASEDWPINPDRSVPAH